MLQGTIPQSRSRIEDAQCAVATAGEIQQAHASLSNAIETLTLTVGELLKRIQPVLNDGPRPTGNGDKPIPANGACELSRVANEHTAKIVELESHIREALRELQL